jgi:hypothetical protein
VRQRLGRQLLALRRVGRVDRRRWQAELRPDDVKLLRRHRVRRRAAPGRDALRHRDGVRAGLQRHNVRDEPLVARRHAAPGPEHAPGISEDEMPWRPVFGVFDASHAVGRDGGQGPGNGLRPGREWTEGTVKVH